MGLSDFISAAARTLGQSVVSDLLKRAGISPGRKSSGSAGRKRAQTTASRSRADGASRAGSGSPRRRQSSRHGAAASSFTPPFDYDVAKWGVPAFSYAPEDDGEPDPGEVVWTWIPYEDDPSQGKDRPVLIVAKWNKRFIVVYLTSKDHDRDAAQEAHWGRYWFDVGPGAWDSKNRPSEVRLDRLIVVDPADIRREGGVLDEWLYRKTISAIRTVLSKEI